MDKWRTIVDGDTWFFVKNILGGAFKSPMLGISHDGGKHTIFFRSKQSHCRFRLNQEEYDELVSYLRECQQKSLEYEKDHQYKDNEFIIREVKTRYDAVIHMCSKSKGKVGLKFVLYDSKGEDYVVCGMECFITLNKEQIDEFLR